MAAVKRSNVTEGLSKLWGVCLAAGYPDDDTRAIAAVVDALEHASRNGDSVELHKMELAAHRYLKGRRGGSILAPKQSHLLCVFVALAERELKKKPSGKIPKDTGKVRAGRISTELVAASYEHLWRLRIPTKMYSNAAFHRSATVEITKALKKDGCDGERVVVALLVAYGLQRSDAQYLVDNAGRRAPDKT
jgi:hypothetical protein